MNRLNILAASILLTIRQTEQLRGETVAQYYRAEHALRATPRRRHKITDRAARKRQARWMGLCRFYGQPLIGGDYALGL